jgi:hypothetical protein
MISFEEQVTPILIMYTADRKKGINLHPSLHLRKCLDARTRGDGMGWLQDHGCLVRSQSGAGCNVRGFCTNQKYEVFNSFSIIM